MEQNAHSPTRLILRGKPLPGHPTPDDIRQALSALDERDSVLVLERGPQFFMQCAGTTDAGFAIEYRDGGDASHFMSAGDSIGIEITTNLLTSYLQDDERWRKMILWQPMSPLATKTSLNQEEQPTRLIEKHGSAIVISKHGCLIALGLLLYIAGAFLFLAGPMGSRYSFRTAGNVLILGTACLILSAFVKD